MLNITTAAAKANKSGSGGLQFQYTRNIRALWTTCGKILFFLKRHVVELEAEEEHVGHPEHEVPEPEGGDGPELAPYGARRLFCYTL